MIAETAGISNTGDGGTHMKKLVYIIINMIITLLLLFTIHRNCELFTAVTA